MWHCRSIPNCDFGSDLLPLSIFVACAMTIFIVRSIWGQPVIFVTWLPACACTIFSCVDLKSRLWNICSCWNQEKWRREHKDDFNLVVFLEYPVRSSMMKPLGFAPLPCWRHCSDLLGLENLTSCLWWLDPTTTMFERRSIPENSVVEEPSSLLLWCKRWLVWIWLLL